MSYTNDPSAYNNTPVASKRKGFAIASLVISIVALFIFYFILGPISIALGVYGMVLARSGAASGYKMALAGTIIGIVAFLGGILIRVL